MVVNVYVEGGIINGNVDATTINNSEALREELHRFMQRALNRNDISVVVKNAQAIKRLPNSLLMLRKRRTTIYMWILTVSLS